MWEAGEIQNGYWHKSILLHLCSLCSFLLHFRNIRKGKDDILDMNLIKILLINDL